MQEARHIADLGIAVIVISATNRESQKSGSNQLCSFRDSGELEYGADDAYVMTSTAVDKDLSNVDLAHVKARSRQKQDITLNFYGAYQRFESPAVQQAPKVEVNVWAR